MAEGSPAEAHTPRVAARTSRVAARTSRVAAHTSRVAARASRVAARASRVAAHASRVAARASRVAAHISRVELRALLAEVHASRHLGLVRRQCFGRMPLQEQTVDSSVGQVGLMLHLERLTNAKTVSELSRTDGRRLRAFNQDASIGRASTGEITSSPAKTLIGTATGTGITITFGVAIAAAL